MDSEWSISGSALSTLMFLEEAQSMAEERAQIFSLYEQGPRRRLLADPGDEDKDNIQLIPDKFGFLREKSQPTDRALGTKQRRTESRRLRKWVKMLGNYSKYHQSEKFYQRCRKGIPSEVRGRVWKMLLDVEAKKAQNPGTFKMLKEQARVHCDQFHLIHIAVQRTFPNHLHFRERYGMKQRALFEVLAAYAIYKPEAVGYGQGLSHIVALFLMWLDEEDAFWALVQVMEKEKYSMSGLYKLGSPMLETLLEHLGHIVHRTLPTLGKHLKKQGVRLSDTMARWFTHCFLDEVPFPLALRLWDSFILEGAQVLSTMGYVVLKLNQKRLLKMTGSHLRVTLKQKWDLDDDAVIKQLQACKHELAKRKCLLPPAAKPSEACSKGHGQGHVPERPAAAPTALQDRETAQDPRPLCQRPESPASLAKTSFSETPSVCVVSLEDTDKEDNSTDEDIFEDLEQDTPVLACGTARGPSPARAPWSVWHGGRLLRWWSLPNLPVPVHGTDGPAPELGSQEGPRAPSLHYLKPVGPGPRQAIWVPVTGLKTASCQDLHQSLLERGDTDGLLPPRASLMGEQPRLHSLAGDLFAGPSQLLLVD